MKFSWKKKTSVYIGRFQPFHDGHKQIFLEGLKSSNQVCILVMDSQGIDNKNPFNFKYVEKKIHQALKKYKNQYIIIKIPVIKELIYGRKVGYKIKKIKLSKKIEKISATKIRKEMFINE
jgi:adenylylsulfate kinase